MKFANTIALIGGGLRAPTKREKKRKTRTVATYAKMRARFSIKEFHFVP
jgi:hypothetical protein